MTVKWVRYSRRPGVWLRVEPDQMISNLGLDSAVSSIDKELTEAQMWCQETGCGRRMAYDQWQFKNEKELTAFLLRWS